MRGFDFLLLFQRPQGRFEEHRSEYKAAVCVQGVTLIDFTYCSDFSTAKQGGETITDKQRRVNIITQDHIKEPGFLLYTLRWTEEG